MTYPTVRNQTSFQMRPDLWLARLLPEFLRASCFIGLGGPDGPTGLDADDSDGARRAVFEDFFSEAAVWLANLR